MQKLTSFTFDFSDEVLTINAPKKSKDDDWTITPQGTSALTVRRNDCDRDPHKHNPSISEFKLDWVRSKATPQQFNEKFKLIGCTLEDMIYATDVCIDPQNTTFVAVEPFDPCKAETLKTYQ